MSDPDKNIPRRGFFREGLRHLLTPIEQAIGPIEAAVEQLGNLDHHLRRLAVLRNPNDFLPDIKKDSWFDSPLLH